MRRTVYLLFILLSLGAWAYPAESYNRFSLGLGYDSNVFLDTLGFGSWLGSAGFSSEMKQGKERLYYLGRLDLQLEQFSSFTTFNGRIGAGIYWYPLSGAFVQGFSYFHYFLSLNYGWEAFLSYQQDLGDITTVLLEYNFLRTWGILDLTNENSLEHNLLLGVNVDPLHWLILDVSGELQDEDYNDILVTGENLHSRTWLGNIKLRFLPGPLFRMQFSYQYLLNQANHTTLLILQSTNLIYPYNNAEIHRVGWNAEADLNMKTSIKAGVQKEWISLTSASLLETGWKITAALETYFNPEWKMAIPWQWDILDSDIQGEYQRQRVSIHFSYLW